MSIARTVSSIIARWGEDVVITNHLDHTEKTARGMVQPVTQQGIEQKVPSPLGIQEEGRYLYLGLPQYPLEARVHDVTWQGHRYDVEVTYPIYVGKVLSHWWAVIVPRYAV